MSKASDHDTLKRSLSGDWEARNQLFKKFVWGNSRLRRPGAAYQYMDDFLHDCFTNVLRTGYSFDEEQNLGQWVESVAVWTALERQRLRGSETPAASPRIRMCAGIEAANGDKRPPIAYMPPRKGPEDSLASRLATLVGKPKFSLLCNRAIEGSTWQDAAAATGQPLNTIGPILVSTVDYLVQFFGAPPPLNADLEAVFAWAVREDASTSHGDPAKPKGRIKSMQLDPVFYSPTPEMRAIGLQVPAEVRTIALRDAARASTPPSEVLRDHLSNCHYCADLFRAMLLMQQAIESAPDVDFLLCPGASTLLGTPGDDYEAFDRHLDECPVCPEERARALGEGEGNFGSDTVSARGPGASRRTKLAGAAAAVLVLLAGGYFVQHRSSTTKDQGAPPSPAPAAAPAQSGTANPRYKGLAQPIDLNDVRWLASVLPQNRAIFGQIADQLHHQDGAGAALAASGIADRDAGTEMLYSLILYERGSPDEGYRAMLTSEAMSPRNSFRCWATLQAAIIVGDKKVAAREVEHLSSDPEYAGRAKDLFARMRARG